MIINLKADNRKKKSNRRKKQVSRRKNPIVRLPLFFSLPLHQIGFLLSGFCPRTPHKIRRNKELYNYLLRNKEITEVISYYYLLSRYFLREHFWIVRFLSFRILTLKWRFFRFLLSGVRYIVRFHKINNLTINFRRNV